MEYFSSNIIDDIRWMDVAAAIAIRRMKGLYDRGLLSVDGIGSVSQYDTDCNCIRVFDLSDLYPILHREAYREIRMKIGVTPDKATWEWWKLWESSYS